MEESKQQEINGKIENTQYERPYPAIENGLLQWRSVIPNKFYYIAGSSEEDVISEEELENTPDNKKLVKLDGYRYIAEIRGFSKNESQVLKLTDDLCVIKNTITWRENTYGEKTKTTSIVCVEKLSLREEYKQHLVSIAENRAFCRNVRAYLRIPILAEDEVVVNAQHGAKAANVTSDSVSDPKQRLELLREELDLKDFEKFKQAMIDNGFTEAENWTDNRSCSKGTAVLKAISKLKVLAKEKADKEN